MDVSGTWGNPRSYDNYQSRPQDGNNATARSFKTEIRWKERIAFHLALFNVCLYTSIGKHCFSLLFLMEWNGEWNYFGDTTLPKLHVSEEFQFLRFCPRCYPHIRLMLPHQNYVSWTFNHFLLLINLRLTERVVRPKEVFYGFVRLSVREFVPKPLRYFNCQEFGHNAKVCKEKRRCARCSGDHDYGKCDMGVKPKCCSCRGEHSVAFGGKRLWRW